MNRFQLRDFRFRDIGPVNLTVGPDECAGISGPSGAGKSQFLRAIADLDPHTGEMFLDEAVSDSVPAHEWRRQVGLLPAESAWWGDIVGEHFSEVDEKQLAALGFSPQVMEWEVSRLSSGERQRMSLLRLFANRPAVLLLDEPTANLDPDSVARVEELVQAYRKEYRPAIFWVSHDPRQLGRVADRRFVIADCSFREV